MQQKEEIIFAIIVIVIVLVFLGILVLVMLGRHNLRKNFLMHENDRIKKEFEKILLDTRLEIQEQTLNHVSREIHDNIGQTLSLVRLQINSMSSTPPDVGIANIDDLLEKAIADIRVLSHSLNTNNIQKNGFIESIKQILFQFEKTGKFTTQFIDKENDFMIHDDHGIILFRIVQEVLNNIVKHAQATTIYISIEKNKGHFEIKIIDNGKGFDTGNIERNGGGIGLKNMMDRAKVIGAKLSVHSQVQTGTTITITL